MRFEIGDLVIYNHPGEKTMEAVIVEEQGRPYYDGKHRTCVLYTEGKLKGRVLWPVTSHLFLQEEPEDVVASYFSS